MASARSASLNGSLGDRGAEPLVGSRGLKLKVFGNFHTKKWTKVKDLNEKLPPCVKQTASRSSFDTSRPVSGV